MLFFRPGRKRQVKAQGEALYRSAVESARRPAFYRAYGVPDSLDGRFEMITLHVFILIEAMQRHGERLAPLRQALFDTLFTDMDRSLREMGVGDLGVGKRVRAMAEAFYGRAEAYRRARGSDQAADALEDALSRNLFGTVEAPSAPVLAALARFVDAEIGRLERLPADAFERGEAAIAEPPSVEAGQA